jgi:DNA-binding MurR/RpiR family transcriptional regulator
MTGSANRSLTGRIRTHYAALSPSERLVADLVLNFPGEIASYSASELATMAKTSNTAVTRFIQRLGFQNYDEMRRLARELGSAGSPLYLLDQPPPGARSFVDAHVEVSQRNIATSFADIDPVLIDTVAEALARARQIWLIGVRNGYFLAGYTRWQFIQVREGVHVVPGPGETLGESLASFGPEDVAIVFGLRRRVPMIPQAIKLAEQAGTRVLLIGDQGLPEDFGATWTIRCETRSHAPLDNHTAVLVLIHILAERLIRATATDGRKRLAFIDDLHGELDEL